MGFFGFAHERYGDCHNGNGEKRWREVGQGDQHILQEIQHLGKRRSHARAQGRVFAAFQTGRRSRLRA